MKILRITFWLTPIEHYDSVSKFKKKQWHQELLYIPNILLVYFKGNSFSFPRYLVKNTTLFQSDLLETCPNFYSS